MKFLTTQFYLNKHRELLEQKHRVNLSFTLSPAKTAQCTFSLFLRGEGGRKRGMDVEKEAESEFGKRSRAF